MIIFSDSRDPIWNSRDPNHGGCFIYILITIQTSYRNFDEGPRSLGDSVSVFVLLGKISPRGPSLLHVMKLGFPRYSLGLEASHTSAWKDCQHATSVFNSSFTAAMSKLQQSFSHSEIVIQFHLIICSCFQASHTAAGLFLETNGLI